MTRLYRWTRPIMGAIRSVFGCWWGHDVEYIKTTTRCRACHAYNVVLPHCWRPTGWEG